MCDVFVGELDDPTFNWEGGDWDNNAPRRLSPTFPPVGTSYGPWAVVYRRVQEGQLEGKQTARDS
jgi:hypothetical protein